MVSVRMDPPTAEQLAFRRALLEDPELFQFLREVDRPAPRREPRILPDLTRQGVSRDR